MSRREWERVGFGPVYVRKTYTKLEGAPVIEIKVANKLIKVWATNIRSELDYKVYEGDQ